MARRLRKVHVRRFICALVTLACGFALNNTGAGALEPPRGSLRLPNAALTPGALGAHDGIPVAASDVCRRGYARGLRHRYDESWLHYRAAVFALYGVPHALWRAYTIDHLIPIELGGRPFGIIEGPRGPRWDLRNVWPQPKNEAKRKDAVEDALHRAVCSPRGYHGIHLTLHEADAAIARDWRTTPVGFPAVRRAAPATTAAK